MTDLRENVKWTLTDQALRVKHPNRRKSVCFTKILFMDKYAFLLAKVYKVFRFHMRLSSNGDAHFWFSDHHGHKSAKFYLEYARAEMLLKLIDPEIFDVKVGLGQRDSQFFGLISQSSSNLAFDLESNWHSIDTLQEFWPRLSELRCSVYLLQGAYATELQEKVFERLHMRHIGTNSELALALKQKAEVLSLGFRSLQGEDWSLSSDVINVSAKECHLKVSSGLFMEILPVIRAVANACKDLKLLGICIEQIYAIVDTFDNFLGIVAEYYNSPKDLVDFLNGMPFTSKVFVPMETHCYFEFPNDWLDQVTTRIGLQADQLKASGKVGDFQVIHDHANSQVKFESKVHWWAE